MYDFKPTLANVDRSRMYQISGFRLVCLGQKDM